MIPVPENQPIPSIIELNKDMEPYVIQSARARSSVFEDKFRPIQFVHFSDIHWYTELWNRVMEYINYYSDTIEFAIHSGDYCGTTQENYIDLYNTGTKCVRPVLNCVGNHDCYDETMGKLSPDPSKARELCFNYTKDWDVNFMKVEHSMSYYKDFEDANMRLIVLDCYYHLEEQFKWLKELLDDAREKEIHVMTVSHEPTHPCTGPNDIHFQPYDEWHYAYSAKRGINKEHEFDHIIADFKKAGGIHICHLAGHEHSNFFSFTEHGVLNCAVEKASAWQGCRWIDSHRIRGTKTYDAFNVVTVDTNMHMLKLVKIGNNVDLYLRSRKTLCWDYINNKVISHT